MLKIYDSLQRKKVDFEPLEAGKVKIYWCGPTVYNIPHIGNARGALVGDLIRRYFEYLNYDVLYVSNYTDIDDKMIDIANERGISVSDLANEIIPKIENDYNSLGIRKPDLQPLATENIDSILKIIVLLVQKGFAYVISDGVYFDISKYSNYGQLSGQNLDDLKMGARIKINEEKLNPYDFALWKFKKEGEPFWASPWGDGRPGWHIECSSMTYAVFGEKFDIHGGGLDLTFPHHECEIAQSKCAFSDDSFAKYWIHNGLVKVDDEKMSKSLGNFVLLRDALKDYDSKVVRLAYLQTHYRNPLNLSSDIFEQSKSALDRIHTFVRRIVALKSNNTLENNNSDAFRKIVDMARVGFEDSMNEDFDTSGALGNIFDFFKSVNILLDNEALNGSDIDYMISFLKDVDKIFGIIFFDEEVLDVDVQNLIDKREKARSNKDFALADKIRDDLKEMGIVLDDSKDGVVFKRV